MAATSSRRTTLLPVVPWLLVVATAVAQLVVIPDVAADREGDDPWTAAYVLMFGAVIPVTWAVLETIWVRGTGPMEAFRRTFVLPFAMGALLGLTAGLVRLRPGVQETIRATRREDGWHYWFDASGGGGSLLADLPLNVVANMGSSMLVGLVLIVYVVLPWYAFVRPRAFLEANMMELHPSVLESNILAARVMSIVLMLVLAIPTAVVLLNEADRTGLAWLVGVSLTLVGGWLVSIVMRHQVVDAEAREGLPKEARGLQNRRREARYAFPEDPEDR